MNTFEKWAPLVRHVAGKRFRKSGCEFEDLCQEGYIALLDALKHYDASRGIFKTYAYKCIYNAMAKYAAKEALSKGTQPYGSDTLAYEREPAASDYAADCVELLRKSIPAAEMSLMMARAKGAKLAELAEPLGCSFQCVSDKLHDLYDEARKVLAA